MQGREGKEKEGGIKKVSKRPLNRNPLIGLMEPVPDEKKESATSVRPGLRLSRQPPQTFKKGGREKKRQAAHRCAHFFILMLRPLESCPCVSKGRKEKGGRETKRSVFFIRVLCRRGS